MKKKKKKPTCGRRKRLTPRFFIALLSSLTTSIPSTPPALKRFVHVIRKPCTQTDETVDGKVSQRKSTTYRTVQGSEIFPSPFNAREPCLEAWSLFLPHPVWSAGRGRRRWIPPEVSCLWCSVFPWSHRDTLPHGRTAGAEMEGRRGWAEECVCVCVRECERVCFSINLLLFHCREWCPLACRRFDSPSERSVSSHGSLWRGGSWSYCLPDPTQWSLPSLSRQKGWQDGRRTEVEG